MKFWFAPLEGTTDTVYRRTHHVCFGGVEKYYIPFISPTQNRVITPREWKSVSLEANEGVPVVPQILGKNAGDLLWAIGALGDMGHQEVNLNLGCPSGTVTAKGKGSGLLKDLDALKALLDELYAHAAVPLSVKTRIGFDSDEEWPALLHVLKDYPMHSLIVHPRTRKDFYKGPLHPAAFDLAAEQVKCPLIYNGDLFSREDCERFAARYPQFSTVMVGRGLMADPAMASGERLTVEKIRHFHDRLMDMYSRIYQPDVVQGRLREIMKYLTCSFEDAHKPRKAMRKARGLREHCEAMEWLFRDFPVKEQPGYVPQDWDK